MEIRLCAATTDKDWSKNLTIPIMRHMSHCVRYNFLRANICWHFRLC